MIPNACLLVFLHGEAMHFAPYGIGGCEQPKFVFCDL
jgi:hypothetical protein